MSGRGGKNRGSLASRVALGGVFSGLAVVLMMLSGYLPIATFAAPAFAGLCFVPFSVEFGPKAALLSYVGVAILSVFFVFPVDPEPVFFFVLLLGYYPIIHPYIAKIKSYLLQYVLKLLLFNVALAGIYSILLFLLVSPALQAELADTATWFLGVLVLLGNVTFVVYDILVDKVRIIYIHRFRRYFFKK